MPNEKLAKESHKAINNWKFKERKSHSSFKDNIWDADLDDMLLLSKLNKGIRFLLRVIDMHGLFI